MLISATPNQSTASVTLAGVTTPTIQNISLALANTEYQITLPAGTVRFRVQVRGSSKLKIAYVTGGNYLTLYAGAYYEEGNLSASSLDLFIQSSQGGETLEIVSWV